MEYGNKIGKIACHQTTEILEYKPKQSIGFYTLRNGGQQDKFEEGGREVVCCTDVWSKPLPQEQP